MFVGRQVESRSAPGNWTSPVSIADRTLGSAKGEHVHCLGANRAEQQRIGLALADRCERRRLVWEEGKPSPTTRRLEGANALQQLLPQTDEPAEHCRADVFHRAQVEDQGAGSNFRLAV